MIETTLALPQQAGSLLLATKKAGFGAGKLNGLGGKPKPGESLKAATVREIKEESCLVVSKRNLKQVALLHFYFAGEHRFTCTVFTLQTWKGVPTDTEEMGGFEWHHKTCLPFHRMWAGDQYWLPLVLDGQHIEASIYFNRDGSIVEEFTYKETKFT